MPGHILRLQCSCGFSGEVSVGIKGVFFESRHLVAAYDPDAGAMISVEEQEAKSRNLTIYRDPYIGLCAGCGGQDTPVPNGEEARFDCPKCGNNALRFYKQGLWK